MEDYTRVTGIEEFPFQFYKRRWVENIRVASRLLAMLPHIREYSAAVEQKEVNKPTCKSWGC